MDPEADWKRFIVSRVVRWTDDVEVKTILADLVGPLIGLSLVSSMNINKHKTMTCLHRSQHTRRSTS